MVEKTNFSSAFGRATSTTALLAGGAAAVGSALLGYGLYETQKFGLRRETVKVLPPGAADMRVLHLSDIHMNSRTSSETPLTLTFSWQMSNPTT